MHQHIKQMNILYCISMWMLVILLIFAHFTVTAVADEKGNCGDSLKWELEGGQLKISGSGAMTEYTEDNLPPWYEYRKDITVVSLPEGMTSIGKFAFYGCTSLKGVSLPSSLTAIGDWSFSKCSNLEYVSIPLGLQSIGESAFQECEALNGVRLPNGITTIKDRAFYMCSSLQSITVPNTVTEFGTAVFAWCDSLVYINFEAPVSTLPTWSFYNCESLNTLNVSSSVQSVGEETFTGCGNLSNVYYPSENPDGWAWLQGEIESDNRSFAGNGTVDGTAPNNFGTIGSSTDEGFHSSKVSDSENATITSTTTVKTEIDTQTNETTTKNSTTISAIVDNEDGWDEVQKLVDDALAQQEKDGNTDSVVVEVQINGSSVGKAELDRFAGKNVDLKVTTSSGSSWVIDMSNTSEGSFKKKYELDYVISRMEEDDTKINADSVYQIDFNKSVDLNTQVGVFVGAGNSYQMATLYRKKTFGYEELQTVIVDAEGNVWFGFPGVDASDKYFVGINAEGVLPEQAAVADNAYSEYEYDEESYLMDENGVRYELTGRTSKWGITGKQFAIYVGIAVGLIVIIVTAVMVTLNKMNKSKAKYMRRAKEPDDEPIDEDALRMEIMNEMLNDIKKKNNSTKK